VTTSPPIPIQHWTDALQAAIDPLPTPRMFQRVTVLAETGSTQDAASRLHAQPGDIVVAWRQISGRGRLGRAWADTGENGVAMTLVIKPDRPERLAIAAAVGTALGIESATSLVTGIKWPNDVMINSRKVAGVLIEQNADRALIGIGVNVHQTTWPAELADRAISLHQAGASVDRLDVMCLLLASLARALTMSDKDLAAAFIQRDGLHGTRAGFCCGETTVHGTVLRVDPMRGLAVRTNDGREVWLEAARTTMMKD